MHFYLHLSDGDKSFVGTLLGAFLGTIGAFTIALYAAWQERHNVKVREKRTKLRAYNQTLIAIELNLNAFIITLMKSARLALNISQIEDLGGFMMTLPRVMTLTSQGIENTMNPQLTNYWISLVIQATIVNELTEDFLEAYKNSRDTIYPILLRNEQFNTKMVRDSHDMLVSMSIDVNAGISQVLENAFRMLALVQLHGIKGQDEAERFRSPDELPKFDFSSEDIDKQKIDLKKSFNEDEVFKDLPH